MWTVSISIEENEIFTASQILADLRTVAETLFHPLRLVGFWDNQADGMHLCPYESQKKQCPHKLPFSNTAYIAYSKTAERELDAILEVYFPHARLYVYLK